MSSSSRLEGDRYQHLYSWYEILQILDDDSGFDYAIVEHRGAGSVDDLTLFPKPGAKAIPKFYQIKWHVDHSDTYTFQVMFKVPANSRRSLLQKLFDSWKKLKSQGMTKLEVWLVSNWASAKEIGQYIVGRDNSIDTSFLDCGKGQIKKDHENICSHIKAADADLHLFLKDLRLLLGFHSIQALEASLDDRMKGFGLQWGKPARATAIDLVKEWIETGNGTYKIDRQTLLNAITEHGLWRPKADAPKVSLWFHGWIKEEYGGNKTAEFDWQKYFDRTSRRVPPLEVWQETLLPELVAEKLKLLQMPAGEGKYLSVRGKMSLTGLLAIGSVFPRVGGFRVDWEQQSGPKTDSWDSSAEPSDKTFSANTTEVKDAEDTNDALFVLSVTGDGLKDALEFVKSSGLSVSKVYNLIPSDGVGPMSLSGAADAVALAIDAKEKMRLHKVQNGGNIHIILYAPAGFALFLGQQLNALGTIYGYERTETGGYAHSVTIKTG